MVELFAFENIIQSDNVQRTNQVGGFELVLKKDLTWRSTAGFGGGNYIQGRWNVFEESVDLHSGIPGAGQRFWLQYRPFGMLGGATAKGVPGLEEFVYLGQVRRSLGVVVSGGCTLGG
jgi:hypothetical protein